MVLCFTNPYHSEKMSVVHVYEDGNGDEFLGSLVGEKGEWYTNEALTEFLELDEPLRSDTLGELKVEIGDLRYGTDH